MSDTFKQAVAAWSKTMDTKQGVIPWQTAMMGDGKGNVVDPNNLSYVFVRLPGATNAISVLNKRMIPVDGVLIKIGKLPEEPTVWQVISQSDPRLEPLGINYDAAGLHSWLHRYLAADQVDIDWRQITNLRVYHNSTLADFTVGIKTGIIPRIGGDIEVAEQTLDLTSHIPAAGALWVLISIDADGLLAATDGDLQSGVLDLLLSTKPVTPSGHFRLAAVRMYAGQTSISEITVSNDFMDLRWPQEFMAGDPLAQWGKQAKNTALRGPASGSDAMPSFRADVNDDLPNPITLKAATTLTISSGAVTVSKNYHILAAQSGTTDDLETISAGVATQVVMLQADAGDTITVKHGTGNIFLNGETDFELSDDKSLMLFYNGTNWSDIGAGGGLGSLVTAPFSINVDGALAIATDVGAFVSTGNGTMRAVYIRCKTTGSSGTTAVDVHLNGTTIFTTQSNRPALAWNDVNGVAKSGTPELIDLIEGDVLTFHIDGVTVGASDLVIVPAIDWSAKTPVPAACINIDGVLAVASDVAAIVVSTPGSLKKVYIRCKTLGTSGSTIIDVHLNGTTVFTDPDDRPALAWDDADGVAFSVPAVADLSEGDVLTFHIDQVAVGAASLTITPSVDWRGNATGNVHSPASVSTGHFAVFADDTGMQLEDGGVVGSAAHAATADFDAAGAAAARAAQGTNSDITALKGIVASDLGNADVNLNFGNTHSGKVTNITTDGTITASNISGTTSGTNTGDQTLPVKATGAEVNTGTNDTKFVTPKSVADSKLVSGPASITDGHLAVWDNNAKTLKDGGAVPSGGGITVDDEGTPLATVATELDFVGDGVTASGSGSKKTITIPGGGSAITVDDEGTPLATVATELDFVGAGVTASGTGAKKTITIPGGSAGVTRSGSTTNGHAALWNGSSADSIKDGPALGTAASAATGDFATAAQGAKADTALQSIVITHQALLPDDADVVAIGEVQWRIYNHFGVTLTITGVYISVTTAPTGAAIIVDIHKAGTTIFTNQAHRPQIADGAYTGNTSTIDVSAWADGEYLTLCKDQVGSTVAGGKLMATVVCTGG